MKRQVLLVVGIVVITVIGLLLFRSSQSPQATDLSTSDRAGAVAQTVASG